MHIRRIDLAARIMMLHMRKINGFHSTTALQRCACLLRAAQRHLRELTYLTTFTSAENTVETPASTMFGRQLSLLSLYALCTLVVDVVACCSTAAQAGLLARRGAASARIELIRSAYRVSQLLRRIVQ